MEPRRYAAARMSAERDMRSGDFRLKIVDFRFPKTRVPYNLQSKILNLKSPIREGVLGLQCESCQFCVPGSFRGELALVQNELAGNHGTKLGDGKRGQLFLQIGKRAIGPVSFAP